MTKVTTERSGKGREPQLWGQGLAAPIQNELSRSLISQVFCREVTP